MKKSKGTEMLEERKSDKQGEIEFYGRAIENNEKSIIRNKGTIEILKNDIKELEEDINIINNNRK